VRLKIRWDGKGEEIDAGSRAAAGGDAPWTGLDEMRWGSRLNRARFVRGLLPSWWRPVAFAKKVVWDPSVVGSKVVVRGCSK